MPASAGEYPCGDEVRAESGDRDNQHRTAANIRRRAQTLNRFPEDVDRDRDQRRGVDDCGQHLRTEIPVRALCGRRSAGKPDRDQREGEGCNVGQHVSGIGQEGERIGQVTADRLDNHESGGDTERNRDRPKACAFGARRVVLIVLVVGRRRRRHRGHLCRFLVSRMFGSFRQRVGPSTMHRALTHPERIFDQYVRKPPK